MSKFKLILSIIISIFAFSSLANAQFLLKESMHKISFANSYPNEFIFSLEQALDFFEGDWTGTQQYYIADDMVASYFIEQQYSKSRKSIYPRLIGVGKIITNGKSIEIKSYLYIKNGLLYNDNINPQDGSVESYVANIEDNTLVWIPKHLVSSYYIQTDNFAKDGNKLNMKSLAYKHLILPDKNVDTHLRIESNMSKTNIEKKQLKTPSILSFPKSFMQN